MDVPRRPRSGGPAARDRQPTDRSLPAYELAGLSPHPEQRPVSSGEKEAPQDLTQHSASATLAHPTLSAAAAAAMRGAIRLAGGREVCFAATMDEHAVVRT